MSNLRDELIEHGILADGGAPGLYHRGGAFEDVVSGIEALFRSLDPYDSPRWVMSPVTTAQVLVDTDYVESFPQLMGLLDGFHGDAREARTLADTAHDGGEWWQQLDATGLALRPAACHGLYPLLAGRQMPPGGGHYEISATCFRHEPSDNPARMQTFRMQEFVVVGTPEEARAFRDAWLERALDAHRSLGLVVEAEAANDPFFGRASQMMSQGQLEKELKFEIVAPIAQETPNAISSANYHEDHFGTSFAITTSTGVAESACFAVGLERSALALFRRHGVEVSSWPTDVAARLGL